NVLHVSFLFFFFFSSRRRHTRFKCDWSSDVCSSDLVIPFLPPSIQGLSQFGGFTYELLDQSGGPIQNLEAAAQQLIAQANRTPRSEERRVGKECRTRR